VVWGGHDRQQAARDEPFSTLLDPSKTMGAKKLIYTKNFDTDAVGFAVCAP
jgi:hypothetical protein